jgi:beta-lactamase class A
MEDRHCNVLVYGLAMVTVVTTTPASVAVFDYEAGRAWTRAGDRWHHAASTIKIAVLGCVFATLQEDRLDPGHALLVVNRFSSARDGLPFSVPAARDTDAATHAAIGQPVPIGDLARRMIGVSGNLATNVLLDFVGLDRARRILDERGLHGVDLVRGVEDDRAFEAGVFNRVTATGLVGLLRAILDRRFASEPYTTQMIENLCGQTFTRGIPAGLPAAVRPSARVAHKTGEISTATHDAGIVFLAGRAPYVLAVLTGASGPERYAPIAAVSQQVFEAVTAGGEPAISKRMGEWRVG